MNGNKFTIKPPSKEIARLSIFIFLFLKRIFNERIISEKNKLKTKLNPIMPVSASSWIYIL